MALYRESIRDMQQRLVDSDFLKGGVDGCLRAGHESGGRAFQKATVCRATGNPDVRTLIAMFYSRAAAREWYRPAPAPSRAHPRQNRPPRLPTTPAPAGQPPTKLTSTSHRRRNSPGRPDLGGAAHMPPM